MTYETALVESDALLFANGREERTYSQRASTPESAIEYARFALDYAATFGFYADVAYNYADVAGKLAAYEAAHIPAGEPAAYLHAVSLTWRACELIRCARRRRREQLRVVLFPEQHA